MIAKQGLLTVNEEFTLSIVISRHTTTPSGNSRWVIRVDQGLSPDITVAVRMNQDNTLPIDYYLLPLIDTTFEKLRVAEDNGIYLDTYRFDELYYLFSLAERTNMKRVV